MRLMRQGLPALLAVVFLLTLPTDADAQLRWIRKFSGPEYKPPISTCSDFVSAEKSKEQQVEKTMSKSKAATTTVGPESE